MDLCRNLIKNTSEGVRVKSVGRELKLRSKTFIHEYKFVSFSFMNPADMNYYKKHKTLECEGERIHTDAKYL